MTRAMTDEQKVEWLMAASDEEIIDQLRWAVIRITSEDNILIQFEGQNDYDLISKELKRRMSAKES